MRHNEYYSDRKIRFMFDVSHVQLLEAKAGDPSFDVEDIRFCYSCDRWFDADFHIATVEHEGQYDFVCSRCADRFESLAPTDKHHFLMCGDYAFRYWKDQHQMATQLT